ncbi:MAG: hypothetical protein QM768_23570 [Agriterribacter sp.]
MRYIIAMALVIMSGVDTNAQTSQTLFIGPGFGFDHGRIGVKAEFQPVKYIGVFAGAGYNLANVGANAGVICNVLPDKRITPVVLAGTIIFYVVGKAFRQIFYEIYK